MEANRNGEPKCKAHGTFTLGWANIWLHLLFTKSYLLRKNTATTSHLIGPM